MITDSLVIIRPFKMVNFTSFEWYFCTPEIKIKQEALILIIIFVIVCIVNQLVESNYTHNIGILCVQRNINANVYLCADIL